MTNNTGHRNSGHRNSGDFNSGDFNSGDFNSGDFNSGDFNSGMFNTDEPKIRIFNKDTNYTYSEFDSKFGMKYPDLHICQWIEEDNMTDKEKEEVDGWKTMNGYLKTIDYKEAWAEYWQRASEEDKNWFLNLPNFSTDIFKEITGIDTKEKMIELSNGKKVSESTVIEALKTITEG